MADRTFILFLDEKRTKQYIENSNEFKIKAGERYIHTRWGGYEDNICAIVDFARFLEIDKMSEECRIYEFYALLRNWAICGDARNCLFEDGKPLYGEKLYNGVYVIEQEEDDDDTLNEKQEYYLGNKPCVISSDFEIISYTPEEVANARNSDHYNKVFNLLKKQYAKIETQICESVIDGIKLANQLGQEEAYELLINDNNGSYREDKHQLGIVLVNNLRFMSNEYSNNAEYGIYEAWTKENIDAVCKMLDAMFEFCNKRQIKYININ